MNGLHQLMLSLPAESSGSAEGPSFLGLAVYIAFVLAILFCTMAFAKKGLGVRVYTNPVTRLYEHVYLFVENLCISTIGPHGRKYVPMMMSYWLIIFVGNIISLFFPTSPTSSLSFNLALALIAMAYVQYEGMLAHGVWGHIKHFAGPKLGPVLIPITILIFFIEIISETMKNLSLSLRLYGNIHGGHLAVHAMNKLGDPVYVPLGALVLFPLKLLTCIVQALIFTVLTCVYLSLVTHSEEEDSGGDSAAAHAH